MIGKVVYMFNGNILTGVPTNCFVDHAEGTLSNFLDDLVVLEHIRPAVLEFKALVHLCDLSAWNLGRIIYDINFFKFPFFYMRIGIIGLLDFGVLVLRI